MSNPMILSHRDLLENVLGELIADELKASEWSVPYVVLASEIGFGEGLHVNGLANSCFPWLLRSVIGSRWRGAAPTVMVNDLNLVRHSGKNPFEAASMMTSIGLHELSHLIDMPTMCLPFVTECSVETLDKWKDSIRKIPTPPITVLPDAVESSELPDNTEAGADITSVPVAQKSDFWSSCSDCHGPQFVRIATHLAFRMNRRGWPVNVEYLHGWQLYNPLNPATCIDILRDELTKYESLSLSELKSIPIPSRFLELWSTNVATAT